MKILQLNILALFISIGITAQTDQESIQQTAEGYMVHVQNNDIEQILDAMLPQLFEVVNRNQMKSSMEQMFNNPSMKVEYL